MSIVSFDFWPKDISTCMQWKVFNFFSQQGGMQSVLPSTFRIFSALLLHILVSKPMKKNLLFRNSPQRTWFPFSWTFYQSNNLIHDLSQSHGSSLQNLGNQGWQLLVYIHFIEFCFDVMCRTDTYLQPVSISSIDFLL